MYDGESDEGNPGSVVVEGGPNDVTKGLVTVAKTGHV